MRVVGDALIPMFEELVVECLFCRSTTLEQKETERECFRSVSHIALPTKSEVLLLSSECRKVGKCGRLQA